MTIAESVEEIGQWAFWNCEGLQTVYIPKNVRVMDEGIFTACWQLTAIVVDAQNSNYYSVDGVLLTKDLSTLCAYPIGKDNKAYTVPEGVKRIEIRAFDSSSLESVILPDGVVEISAFAFDYCRELTKIRIAVSTKTISEEAFRGIDAENITIYGEIGSYAEEFAGENGMVFIAGDIPESICDHANTRSEYSKTTYTQIAGNEKQHQMIKHYKVICDECNVTLDAEGMP